MDKAYNHKDVEDRVYKSWEESGYFKPEINPNGEPYSIVLPPPNVTGTLHIGHALMLVVEDILVRYHRMRGFKTLWLPGTDHAAIATQSKVETILYKEEGKTRYDLGREEFLKKVEDFAKDSHNTIVHQIRKMGASVDWEREAYTLDAERGLAVRTAFKKMFDQGLIYRGDTIVNWDPKMQTTVSDDEIEWKQEKTSFYYLQYGPFVIGTARPETKFGDKYVVMHPDDKRYKNYKHGEKLKIEWINGEVEAIIIKDSSVDMEFGTGVMTITPWHDKTDFEIANRHNLSREQIVDFNGKLLDIAREFSGIHIKKARPMIVEKLKEKNLIVKIDENYVHKIAVNYRGSGVIEPQIKKQWMINVNMEFEIEESKISGVKSGERTTLKYLMKHVVESNQIEIKPAHFLKTYYNWIDNLRDWCISRQIWYGHQIPVYYCGEDNTKYFVSIETPSACRICGNCRFFQDPDTLDTWFSSGLWTFSTLGWPNNTDDLNSFHPTSVLETGYDILFFWVARMILMTTCIRGEIPFKKVLLHGLVRDENKQKMSKSKGNVIDPLSISETYGTDALRIALVFSTAAGNDIPMSEDKVRGMKHFANKLWNIARFIDMGSISAAREYEDLDYKTVNEVFKNVKIKDRDLDMMKKLNILSKETTLDIDSFRLNEAAQRLYDFAWHEFADLYVESIKEDIKSSNEDKYPSYELIRSMYLDLIKLIHPFMPFVTEEIFQKLRYGKSLMISSWPYEKTS